MERMRAGRARTGGLGYSWTKVMMGWQNGFCSGGSGNFDNVLHVTGGSVSNTSQFVYEKSIELGLMLRLSVCLYVCPSVCCRERERESSFRGL